MPVYDFSSAFQNLNSGIGALDAGLEKARQEQWLRQAAALAASQLPSGDVAAPVSPAASLAPAAPKMSTFAALAGTPTTTKLSELITGTAAKYGVDPDTMIRTAQIESGFDPNAQNPNSSAGGLFQFTNDTAKQYGLANKLDPVASTDAAARLMKDNANVLRQGLGRDPTPGELYLAHQQGATGALRLLANPNAPAASVVGAKAVTQNGGTPDMTAADFAARWTSKFADTGGKAPKTSYAKEEDFVPGTTAVPPSPPQYPAATGVPAAGSRPTASAISQIAPQEATRLRAMLANPVTAPAAMAEINKLSQPEDYEIKEVGGQVYRIGKRTGAAQVVQGVAKPQDWNQFKASDGNDYIYNKQTGELKRAVEGGAYTDITDPEELARIRPPGYQGPAQRGPDNKLEFPGAGAAGINLETAGQAESQKARIKRYDEWITEGAQAQKGRLDLENLRELGRNIGPAGVTAPIKEALGPYAQALGVDISGLSDIQAYQRIIKQMTPNMRPPGSGATSNYEEKLYQASLPGLLMHPQAREMALDTMQAANDHAIARAKIGQDAIDGVITHAEAAKQIRALPDPLDRFREFRKTNPTIIRDAAQGKITAGPPTELPKGYTADKARAEAKNAIANGKPRDAVLQRLQSMGVDASGL